MKGEMDIQSVTGKGTTITIYFPASEKVEEELNIRDTIFYGSSNEIIYLSRLQPLILIVEDDNSSRKMLEITLSKIARVDLVQDGNEALEFIDIKFKNGQKYDLILLDIGLPLPWDGIRLRREIIKRWEDYKNIPFIAQTAFAMNEDKNRILKAGFNAYLAKPIDRRDLIKTIAQLLHEAGI
jgi:CheY-like chemotaxis protein